LYFDAATAETAAIIKEINAELRRHIKRVFWAIGASCLHFSFLSTSSIPEKVPKLNLA